MIRRGLACPNGMSPTPPRRLFLNLPVRDLGRSMEFFRKLGFEFEPRFTDENAACMVVNAHAFVMLLAERYFTSFTKKRPCDTSTHTESLCALSCASRGEVSALVERAWAAGATPAMDPVDHGFMVGWSFYDLDGHHWEAIWVDEQAFGATAHAS